MDFFEILRIVTIFGGGLMAGSFVNCVIWRLHSKENFITGRSYCPRCRHKLASKDLVPIFSFLWLSGKCRYCKEGISWQYPAVETVSAILALMVAYVFAPGFVKTGFADFATVFTLIYYWTLCAVLEIVFVSDLLWFIIPDEALVFGVGLAVVAQAFAGVSPLGAAIAGGHSLNNTVLSGVITSLVFLAIVLVSRGLWMGLGDVKYAFFMGIILGFPEIIFGLFAAFLSGAAVGIVLILAGRKKLSSEIPFGPFLAASTLAAVFFARYAIDWYLGLA